MKILKLKCQIFLLSSTLHRKHAKSKNRKNLLFQFELVSEQRYNRTHIFDDLRVYVWSEIRSNRKIRLFVNQYIFCLLKLLLLANSDGKRWSCYLVGRQNSFLLKCISKSDNKYSHGINTKIYIFKWQYNRRVERASV